MFRTAAHITCCVFGVSKIKSQTRDENTFTHFRCDCTNIAGELYNMYFVYVLELISTSVDDFFLMFNGNTKLNCLVHLSFLFMAIASCGYAMRHLYIWYLWCLVPHLPLSQFNFIYFLPSTLEVALLWYVEYCDMLCGVQIIIIRIESQIAGRLWFNSFHIFPFQVFSMTSVKCFSTYLILSKFNIFDRGFM